MASRFIGGTKKYIAPEHAEILKETDAMSIMRLRQKSDIWAFGIVVFELLVDSLAEIPMHYPNSSSSSASNSMRLVLTQEQQQTVGAMKYLEDLLSKYLLVENPNERASALQILQHPYFSKSDKVTSSRESVMSIESKMKMITTYFKTIRLESKQYIPLQCKSSNVVDALLGFISSKKKLGDYFDLPTVTYTGESGKRKQKNYKILLLLLLLFIVF